jgi:hypothetical protein
MGPFNRRRICSQHNHWKGTVALVEDDLSIVCDTPLFRRKGPTETN